MTVKKSHTLNMAWRGLHAANERTGRMVSAGEFAKEMGVSRNTAFNWLIEMLQEREISYEHRQRGNVIVARFGVFGFSFEEAVSVKGGEECQ